MEFKFDSLIATRNTNGSYTFEGILNQKNTLKKVIDMSYETNTNFGSDLDNTFDPDKDQINFSTNFDFHNITQPGDMLDFVIRHITQSASNHTTNSIQIKDTIYPPPYSGKVLESLPSDKSLGKRQVNEHTLFNSLFTVEKVSILRTSNDEFKLDVELSYVDQSNDYTHEDYKILPDTYNKVDGHPCRAIVLLINVHPANEGTNPAKRLIFKDKCFKLAQYDNPCIAVVVTKEKENAITWKQIVTKQIALRIK
jgi:hypothetical protein